MEIILTKNFQAEYLEKISDELKILAFQFRNLYTSSYDKIEQLKHEAVSAQVTSGIASVSKTVGNFIGKIPVVSRGPVDEFLIAAGDSIDDAEKEDMKKTLAFFIQHKDSGIYPIAERIDMINALSNKPTVMLVDNNNVHFHELKEAI